MKEKDEVADRLEKEMDDYMCGDTEVELLEQAASVIRELLDLGLTIGTMATAHDWLASYDSKVRDDREELHRYRLLLAQADAVELCPDCGEPLGRCPSGMVCSNGHGF